MGLYGSRGLQLPTMLLFFPPRPAFLQEVSTLRRPQPLWFHR